MPKTVPARSRPRNAPEPESERIPAMDGRSHEWELHPSGEARCARCGARRRAVLVLDTRGRIAASIETHGPRQKCPGHEWWNTGVHKWRSRDEPAAEWDAPRSSPKRGRR